MDGSVNLEDWYTPADAAKRLSANSGKEIDVSYVRTLARYGKIEVLRIGTQMRLYKKSDVDSYIVEERGDKAGRVKRQKAVESSKQRAVNSH